MSKVLIIPAAGRGSRMMGLTEKNPKVMLPYEGKPIISHNIELAIKNGIKDIIIVVGYKKEKVINYVLKFYKDKANIKFVEQTELNGLAGALYKATEIIKEDSEVLVVLGDIILKSDIFFHKKLKNHLFYTNKEDYKRWCMVDVDNNGRVSFFDKPDVKPPTDKALIGVYSFSSSERLNSCLTIHLSTENKIGGEYQLSGALKYYYNKDVNIKLAMASDDSYFDMGEVEDLIDTRKNITRHFNNIKKTKYGTIIKTSKDKDKMKKEANWYLSIPQKMKLFTPQLFDIHSDGYELEFINSTPVQELFIYDLMELSDWEKFFDKVNMLINTSKEDSANFDYTQLAESAESVYINKTRKRYCDLKESGFLKNYGFDSEFVTINNIVYKNPFYQIKTIESLLIRKADCLTVKAAGHIHGDLFFGNMFYDIPTQQLKVIDPRGSFGYGEIGDIRYDIAKLNHSLYGNYDFIVNELYTLNIESRGVFEYSLYEGKQDNVRKIFKDKILSNYNEEEIDILTGLLFFTMIPLHAENPKNQIIQAIIATKFLNKYI